MKKVYVRRDGTVVYSLGIQIEEDALALLREEEEYREERGQNVRRSQILRDAIIAYLMLPPEERPRHMRRPV